MSATVIVRGQVSPSFDRANRVRVSVRSLLGGAIEETLVGEAAADRDGSFLLSTVAAAAAHGEHSVLAVQLIDVQGRPVAERLHDLDGAGELSVDFDDELDSAELDEFTRREAAVSFAFRSGAEALTSLDEASGPEVASWVGADPDELELFRRVRVLERDTGVPAAALYALERSGTSLVLAELVDITAQELRETLFDAVEQGLIARDLQPRIDDLVTRLCEAVAERACRVERWPAEPGLGAVLAGLDLDEDGRRAALRRYQHRAPSADSGWDPSEDGAWAEEEGALGDELGAALELAALVGCDPPLVRHLVQQRRAGEWQRVSDLSGLTFDAWCELLQPFAAEDEVTQEDWSEEQRRGYVEDWASAVTEAFETAYPSECIRRELFASDGLSPGAKQLLDRAPEHDFSSDSLRRRVDADGELARSLAPEELEQALSEVEGVERLSRVTHRAAELATLRDAGLSSAQEIACVNRRSFIETFAEPLGGRAQAARIHAQAQQNAAANQLALLGLLQDEQTGARVLEKPVSDALWPNVPNLRELFGAGVLCDCPHCGSVYSPAAYYVDLLRYLDDAKRLESTRGEARASAASRQLPQSTSNEQRLRHQPLDVLLARRPDLIDIPLTCDNTLTPLPYIDLVNEILESRVSGRPVPADTGKVPAEVLRAVPQHLDRAAYDVLERANYPLGLPFHEPLAVCRAYLAHLGASRLELMRTFAAGPPTSPERVGEALAMSPSELEQCLRPPSGLEGNFGFTSSEEGLGSAPASVFCGAAGISFEQLVELLSMRFLNATGAITLDTPSLDCDPERVRVVGFDRPRFARLLQLLRVQRRLGFRFAELDRALLALGITELDLPALAKLVEARELVKRLDRSLDELLVLWAPFIATDPDSQFHRLLSTRAVAWHVGDDALALRADGTELKNTADELTTVVPALLAAFRLTHEELTVLSAIYARRSARPRLDLAGLSAIYRAILLARATRVSPRQLDLLLKMAPADADPFTPGDPAATRRFIELVEQVQSSEFSVEQLGYLFLHDVESRRDPSPKPEHVQAVAAALRRGLADAIEESTLPNELLDGTLRQKLGLFLDASLLDAALETLDPRSRMTAPKRREFFDRHLSRIFSDPAGAAASLLEGAAADASTSEQRFRKNAQLVLDHLLPKLRTKLQRGAVMQVLADSLGLDTGTVARLVEEVLRSRARPGEPMIGDFAALQGGGLRASYFAKSDEGGAPAVVRLEPQISFGWAGAAPVEGVPAAGFRLRLEGRLAPKQSGTYTLYLTTEGAARLLLTVGGSERVLVDTAGGARPEEHASPGVSLEAGKLYELKLDYRNLGGAGTLQLMWGVGPSAKQPISSTELFPSDGPSSFSVMEESYRRLHKAALLLSGFGANERHLAWISEGPRVIDLDSLPLQADSPELGRSLFRAWRLLAGLYALRKRLPSTGTDLFDVFRAPSGVAAAAVLLQATGWDPTVVTDLLAQPGFAATSAGDVGGVTEPLLLRLARAVELQRRTGVSAAALARWASQVPDAAQAAEVMQAVKAKYDEARWLEVARSVNDPLRRARRDALVAYLLPRLREKGVSRQNQLFEYLLIDVEMSPCMLTSRIRQAIGAVQTFMQRCLMSLEVVHPRFIDESDWKYLKTYRVWEANRKIFLYPENWIEPELRDDKSPLFLGLERAILQDEIKHENVEAAFAEYLQGLDELAQLDVRAVCFDRGGSARRRPRVVGSQWDIGTYHVFARSFSPPYVWYYRRLNHGRDWTPWEKLEADIEGDHLLPVLFHGRLCLFWAIFREVGKRPPPQERESKGASVELGKDWEVQLAYVTYERGRWSRKRLSEDSLRDALSIPLRVDKPAKRGQKRPSFTLQDLGSASLPTSCYTLRAVVERGRVRVILHRRKVRLDARVDGPELVKWLAHRELVDLNLPFIKPKKRDLIGEWVERWGRVPPEQRLEDVTVERLGQFVLDGCQGALRLASGVGGSGRLLGPAGYVVDASGFAVSHRTGSGALLTLPGAATPVLRAPRTVGAATRVLPVADFHLEASTLVPLFIQSPAGCLFAQPVPSQRYAAARPFSALNGFLAFGRRRPVPAARRARRPGRRREDVMSELIAEAEPDSALELAESPADLDVWEQIQDESWHPEDAAELFKRKRKRRGPAAPGRAPAARRATKPVASRAVSPAARPAAAPPPITLTERYRFSSFQHSHTCALLEVLRAEGLGKLLQLATQDHHYPRGSRVDRGQAFRQLQPTSFVDPRHPHLDLSFVFGSPYGNYNWELFFHAPLQIALRLAKDGRHEEAQRWFHFIFDPTVDASDPSPARYWRFLPLHQHSKQHGARQLTELLGGGANGGLEPSLEAQLTAWQESPFSPHVIARLRLTAYQKTVVMKYIDNLIEWGDKLFKQDTMESVHEATQLYVLAGNVLGPRPERIKRPVDVPPTTFRAIRGKGNAFSNWMVKFETSQVRRPFRINARPDVGGVSSALRLETEYFCLPHNPQLEKYWDTVADRLFKIRNCMNIQGVVRQLSLFDPPLDPALLVRAAAAGADLSSVLSSLNAPPPLHRFGPLLRRAVKLAEELRSFGALTLQILERRDAEGLAQLRATNESKLLQASRDIQKKRISQVEMELSELSLQREELELRISHLVAQSQQLMNPQEAASQASMTAAKVYSAVAEGIDLVSKVMYAIPEMQLGTAGGFSSPFVTAQVGGQMLGAISGALSTSMEKIVARNETEAELAAAQAEFQRRREEWQHEIEVLSKEKAQVDKHMAKARLSLEIVNAELKRHDLEAENAQRVQAFLQTKYTNEQLYGWMVGQLATVHFQVYKVAFDAAQQAQRAFQFERGEGSATFIEFAYWDSLKRGLFAGERLLLDLRRLEAAKLEGDRRGLEVTRHLSLRRDFPLAFQELLATGRCQLDVTEALLDGDFPGHYFRRIKTVSLSASSGAAPYTNLNGTLSLLGSRVRTDATASGNYAPSEDGEDARFVQFPGPPQVIATSGTSGDHGVFRAEGDDARLLPFEGAGAISTWRLQLHQADNPLDLSAVADLVLSLSYTARSGGLPLETAARTSRERLLTRGGLKPEPMHRVSLRHDLPELWKRLREASPGQSVEGTLSLTAEQLPARFRHNDVRFEQVVAFAQARAELPADSLKLGLEPAKGSATRLAGWSAPWPGSKTLRTVAELAGQPGEWKVSVGLDRLKPAEVLEDIVLCFALRARR